MFEWISKHDSLPKDDERVVTYSPCYEETKDAQKMTYRLMSGQFVRICTDVTHWAKMHPPQAASSELRLMEVIKELAKEAAANDLMSNERMDKEDYEESRNAVTRANTFRYAIERLHFHLHGRMP
jgi:hypothetical protein